MSIQWPRLIVGEEESNNVQEYIEREIILHTLVSSGATGESLAGIISHMPRNMTLIYSPANGEYAWSSPRLEFKMITVVDANCFCEIFIILNDEIFYHERMRDNRKYPGKVVPWPKEHGTRKKENIPNFENFLPAQIICFVKWLLLTTAELGHRFIDKEGKLTEEYLIRHTTLGKVAKRAQKIEKIIFDAYPKDVAGIIVDYYHSSSINRAPSVKEFLKSAF